MKKSCFHASCEGGQLGFLTLDQFLAEVQAAGGKGAQPSNYMLLENGKLISARRLNQLFANHGMMPESFSCHCLNWVHGAAAYAADTSNQVTKQVIPFVPAQIYKQGAQAVEAWSQDQLFTLMDLAAEANVHILHTFFGPYQGWEVITGYPWGFLTGGKKEDGTDYDLVQEGLERFVRKTAAMRQRANGLKIYFGHEIHRNSAAACADDFAALVEACDGDKCVASGFDPSHCDEGEDWEARLTHPVVAERTIIAHVKNYRARRGVFAGRITGKWGKRSKEFATHGDGVVNLVQYAEVLSDIGYPRRFCEITGRPTAPLVSEAEVARQDQLTATVNGIKWVVSNMLIVPSTGSFEEGMGEKKAEPAPVATTQAPARATTVEELPEPQGPWNAEEHNQPATMAPALPQKTETLHSPVAPEVTAQATGADSLNPAPAAETPPATVPPPDEPSNQDMGCGQGRGEGLGRATTVEETQAPAPAAQETTEEVVAFPTAPVPAATATQPLAAPPCAVPL